MVFLITNTPEYANELSEEIRLFVAERKIEYAQEIAERGITLWHHLEEGAVWSHYVRLFMDGKEVSHYTHTTLSWEDADPLTYKKYRKRGAKTALFRCLVGYYQKKPRWGSLTGIRPTKLMRELAAAQGQAAAEKIFFKEFDVTEEKVQLAATICHNQSDIIASVKRDTADLYLGIPFCTSRCAYCSFASSLTSRDGKREEEYVAALLKELELCQPLLEKVQIRSVYIGGGTPTALPLNLLEAVVKAASRWATGEFTVEAGRPDTITQEKLACLKKNGVNRISINTQTTCDETLLAIGRAHTREDFIRAFRLASQFDFSAINTDLIIGLPGEGKKEFAKSLEDVLSLRPENITVHTLAIKRASAFGMANAHAFASGEEAEEILSYSQTALAQAGYQPYYLYRQKYMTGNLENIGYALPGKRCVYNVDIMEETASILAFGAGSISKRVNLEKNRIDRAANVKDIGLYQDRLEEMVARKKSLFEREDF